MPALRGVILAFGILLGFNASAIGEDGVGPCYDWTEAVEYKADEFMPVREAGVQYNMEIGVIFYDNPKDIVHDLLRQWLKIGVRITSDMQLKAMTVKAFTYWEDTDVEDTMRCVMVLPKPVTVDGVEMCSWGHELAHCVLGQHYHMTRVIVD